MPAGACRASSSSSSSSTSSSSSSSSLKHNHKQQQQQQLECSVYMAPSTLGDTGGNMGMYTGIALQPGDVLNYPEIAIPLLFREWGEHPFARGYDDGKIFDNYIWEGSVMEIESYDDLNRQASRAVFVPGIGCTVNSLLDMANVHSTHGSTFDACDLHRSRDAGVGAFSPYHAAKTKVASSNRNGISAGSELFGKYGDYWIPTIPGVQVTFDHALDAAEDFMRFEYIPFVMKHDDKMSMELKEALWDLTKNIHVGTITMKSQAMSNLPRQSWSLVEDYFLKLQQQQSSNNNSVDDCDDNYTDDYDKNEDDEDASIVRHFIRQQTIRSIDWLQAHGYCQDHLRPGRSTIHQAGRGAFAARDLPKGTIVGFAPLIHTGEHGRVLFDITYYDNVVNSDSTYGQEQEQQQQQQQERHAYDLILNYSFGHANSTILLTPYGGMVNYINHAPTTLQQSPASATTTTTSSTSTSTSSSASNTSTSSITANVRIQWPDQELVSHKPDWLQKDTTFLRNVRKKIGLSLEYVALRDIKQGEEVFMDYGGDWETAWLQHVQQWQPVPDAHLYVHSTQFTARVGEGGGGQQQHYPPTTDGNGVLYFLTTTELESQPYPPNLHTLCLESFTRTTTMPATSDPQQRQQQEAETFYVWIDPMLNTHRRAYCHVVARRVRELLNGGYEYEYDIDLLWKLTDAQAKKSSADTTAPTPSERWIRVFNVPFDGIGIYDKAFSTDWHLHNAFRHEIMIPDDMMPKSWQNGPPPPLQQW
jgi:SET domain